MKARPNDKKLIHNEAADPVERSSAALRLAADGYHGLLPLLIGWLTHDQWLLRIDAAKMLLILEYQPALKATIDMLCNDPVDEVRLCAANALLAVRCWDSNPIAEIIPIFVQQLSVEKDESVVETIYEALLEAIGEEEKAADIPHYFDPANDIDCELLRSKGLLSE